MCIKITETEIRECYEKYNTGIELKKLAKMVNISQSTLRYKFIALGLPMRKCKQSFGPVTAENAGVMRLRKSQAYKETETSGGKYCFKCSNYKSGQLTDSEICIGCYLDKTRPFFEYFSAWKTRQQTIHDSNR